MDLGVRVIKSRYEWALGRNRVYESVNVSGADFVPQCNMKACRVGSLNFSVTLLRILSELFAIQINRSRRTHEFII